MIEPAYRYRAQLERIIDADTLKFRVDCGFGVWAVVTVRLRGVDAPELRTVKGDDARAFVVRLFEEKPDIIIESYKDQMTFARWVADVWLDGELLADLLKKEGWTKP